MTPFAHWRLCIRKLILLLMREREKTKISGETKDRQEKKGEERRGEGRVGALEKREETATTVKWHQRRAKYYVRRKKRKKKQ